LSRASANAQLVGEFLSGQTLVESVQYPGLPSHPDHELAIQQFGDQFGSMVTFNLNGGQAVADDFIAVTQEIPFCPSLGELSTTLSHPVSTSHRRLSDLERNKLGITGGTIRLSIGIESADYILASLAAAFTALAES
jgi:cystathionine beta-lyase/cystathionine gamma-synthase